MKFNIKHNLKVASATAIAIAALVGCQPDTFEEEFRAKPEASFTVTPLADNPNKIVVRNTSSNSFIQKWTFGNNITSQKQVDTVHFKKAGEYTITLTTVGQGGHGVTSKKVVIENDDLCADELFVALTGGCGGQGKVWVLNPGAGTLTVGPPDGGIWWSSSEADVTDAGRVCMFNDEYTFTADEEFLFENFGDMRVDDEGGNPWPSDIGLPIGCHDMNAIPAKYHAWGSGNHSFTLGTGTLTIRGLGAYLGLYKVGQNGTTATPEQEITFEVLELTENKLVVRKSYNWGYWKFVFSPKQ